MTVQQTKPIRALHLNIVLVHCVGFAADHGARPLDLLNVLAVKSL